MSVEQIIEPNEISPDYEEHAKNFLNSQHLIVLIIALGVVFCSQFWYAGITDGLKALFGVQTFEWWHTLIIAFIMTCILYYMVVYVLQLPIVSFV